MSTWTSEARALAGLAFLALTGCDALGGAGKAPYSQVPLADGAVRVAMPFGYCIDPASLRRDFALAARCDTLGAAGPYGGLDLALIIITATPLPEGDGAPDLATLRAGLGGAQVVSEETRGDVPMILSRRSAPPSADLSPTHWRTALAVGGQVVAVSLFAPEGSDLLGRDGARLLADLTAATRLATTAGRT